MRDINSPLRVAYAAALTQVPDVSCYYQFLPNNLNPDNYIVFRSINSNDASTKNSADLHTNITVEIHTKGNVGNQGLSADAIADTVYQLIYQDKQSNLSLSRGQILQTEVANDVTMDFAQRNQNGYISRYITFRHWIFVDGDGSGSGGLLSQGQVFRLEYTAVGGEAGFTSSSLISKSIIEVNVDGVSYSEIITSGSPIGKQALYDTTTGMITIEQTLEPDTQVFILYQLSNSYQSVMRLEYNGTGGEFTVSSSLLIGKTVVSVSRDGVSSSDILSIGTPTNKQVLFDNTTGEITFASALELNEKIIILYQS